MSNIQNRIDTIKKFVNSHEETIDTYKDQIFRMTCWMAHSEKVIEDYKKLLKEWEAELDREVEQRR